MKAKIHTAKALIFAGCFVHFCQDAPGKIGHIAAVSPPCERSVKAGGGMEGNRRQTDNHNEQEGVAMTIKPHPSALRAATLPAFGEGKEVGGIPHNG